MLRQYRPWYFVEHLAREDHDGRFINLIARLLQAGYLEDWHYNATHSGSPQGGIVSPILANIYLDQLDKFVEQELLPAFNRGTVRKTSQVYANLRKWAVRRKERGDIAGYQELMRQRAQLPSKDVNDPDYRRLRYIRYADDFLLGFCGPREEAEEIKQRLQRFLAESLRLTLSPEKTLITHARTEKARFLGYEIGISQNDDHRVDGRRRCNGNVCLLIPADVITRKLATYVRDGKVRARPVLLHDSLYGIVARYQAEWRGLVEYYQLAWNMNVRLGKLRYFMQFSLVKTMAAKLQKSCLEVWNTYQTEVATPLGKRKVIRVHHQRPGKPDLVAQFGGINLVRNLEAKDCDPPTFVPFNPQVELLERLLADECELCGTHGPCQVHHVRRLADLDQPGRREKPEWVKRMIGRKRKTLVVCRKCHEDIHGGRYDAASISTLESRMR